MQLVTEQFPRLPVHQSNPVHEVAILRFIGKSKIKYRDTIYGFKRNPYPPFLPAPDWETWYSKVTVFQINLKALLYHHDNSFTTVSQ